MRRDAARSSRCPPPGRSICGGTANRRRADGLSPSRSSRQQENYVQITRNSLETTPGPSDWFTGAVYIDTVATPSAPSRVGAASVHFTPGARTAWHTHPFGQTIYVTEGIGLCQRRGAAIEVIRPGDRVFFEPGEDHWHGAALDRFMTPLAMQEVDDQGSPVTWGEHVTDDEYNAAPPNSGRLS